MVFHNVTNNNTNSWPWPTDHCDPFLLQIATNESIYQTIPLGLCPDFVTVRIASATLLIAQIGVAIFTIIFSICRRNVEPVKSRSAFLITVGTVMQTILCFIFCLRLLIGRAIYPCSLYTLILFSGASLIIVPYIIRLYRLFIIMKMNELKLKYSKLERESVKVVNTTSQEEATTTTATTPQEVQTNVPIENSNTPIYFSAEKYRSLQKQLSILKFLISPCVLLLPIGVFLVFDVLLWFVLGSIELLIPASIIVDRGFSMNITIGCSVSLVGVVFVGVISFFHILALFILFIANCKTKDTLFIKYEVVVMILIYGSIVILYVMLGLIPFVYKLTDYLIPYGLVLALAPLLDTFVSGCIPTLISLKPKSTARLAKQSKESIDAKLNNIRTILQNATLRAQFLNYAKRSFCPEALLCWQEIEKYKNAKSKKKRVDIFEHIVVTFLENNSPLELNLPLETRQTFITVFQQEQGKLLQMTKRRSFFEKAVVDEEQSFAPNLLNELMKKCEFNLIDVFQRFKEITAVKKLLRDLNKE